MKNVLRICLAIVLLLNATSSMKAPSIPGAAPGTSRVTLLNGALFGGVLVLAGIMLWSDMFFGSEQANADKKIKKLDELYKIRRNVPLYEQFQKYLKFDEQYFENMEKNCAETIAKLKQEHPFPTDGTSRTGHNNNFFEPLLSTNTQCKEEILGYIKENREHTKYFSARRIGECYITNLKNRSQMSDEVANQIRSALLKYEPLVYFHCMDSIKQRYQKNLTVEEIQFFCAKKHLEFFDQELPQFSEYDCIKNKYISAKNYKTWYQTDIRPKIFWFWYKKPDLGAFYMLQMQYRYVKYKQQFDQLGL